MKLRIIKLTPEQVTQLLQGKASSIASNLPEDTELLDIKMDLFAKQVTMVVRSEGFEDVAENQPIPEFHQAKLQEVKPTPAATIKPEAASASAFRTPVIESKPLVPKPAQPPASRYAAKMENEFSPDQRKLLSFTLKGDVVVVKPVQFLKAEWEDINEIVRSLGGRWVKGDIVSYWEIPLQ